MRFAELMARSTISRSEESDGTGIQILRLKKMLKLLDASHSIMNT